ncbi:MAG: fibronectin type III domain-containing protein [Nonlabens sp.]
MRYKLLLLAALFSSAFSIAQTCNYSLELEDVSGFGWSDSASFPDPRVEITLDGGTPTAYRLSGASGTAGSVETFVIPVTDGQIVDIDYFRPALQADATYRLLDSEGIVVYNAGFAPASEDDAYVDVISCPSCASPTNLTVFNVQPREVELEWTQGSTETEWEVEFGENPYSPGSGGTTRVFLATDPNVTITGTTVNVILDGLNPETEYDAYVRAVCDRGTNDLSNSRGPANFTTTPSCPPITEFSTLFVGANQVQFIIEEADGNTAFEYTVFYGPSPYDIGDAGGQSETGFTAPFIAVDGLMSETSYDFFVILNCGPGDVSSPSVRFTVMTLDNNCTDISNLMLSNIDQDGVSLSWTTSGTETEWEVTIGEGSIAADPSPATIVVNSNPYLVSGLDSGTGYEVCVRARCSDLDFGDRVCDTFITEADYCGGDLLVDSGDVSGNYSNSENVTYTVCPDNPGDIVYVDFTTFNLEQRSNTACFDGLTIYDGDSTANPVIMTPSGSSIWCFTQATGVGTGDLTNFPLQSSSTSGCLTFVFTSNGSNTAEGFAASVTCAPPPACPDPSNLAISQPYGEGAILSWTANAGESNWEIEVQPSGTPQGTPMPAAFASVSSNPYLITGLSEMLSYDVYLRAICTSPDVSNWVGPVTFMTTCATATSPYSYDFAQDLGDCWTESNNRTLAEGPVSSSSNWDFFDFANDTSSSNGLAAVITIEDSSGPNNDWLLAPPVDLGPLGHGLGVQFDVALALVFDPGQGSLGSDEYVDLVITDDGGLNWNILRRYDSNSSISGTGQREDINLGGYSGIVRMAFVASVGNTPDAQEGDFYVDNFEVATTAGTSSLSGLEVNVYPNPVVNTLKIATTETIDDIQVFNLQGQLMLSSKPNSTGADLDFSNLTTGMYLVNVRSGEKQEVVRIIKD